LALVCALLLVPATLLFTGQDTAPQAFCVGFLETAQEECFDTEHELVAYQESTAAVPLVTFFRDIGTKGATGYKNFVSAYGRSTCDESASVNEASDGDLRNDKYSNGGTLDRSISSLVIRDGSSCSLLLHSESSFGGVSFRTDETCRDMRSCYGLVSTGGGWRYHNVNDFARSFQLT
jgi:hypothetical protein